MQKSKVIVLSACLLILGFIGGVIVTNEWKDAYQQKGYEFVGEKGDNNMLSLIKECFDNKDTVRVANGKGDDIKDEFLLEMEHPLETKNIEEIYKIWNDLDVTHVSFMGQ